ncbi:hypothetical protein N7468_003073 [Penicillium chermesinum]|uniref:Uncharacterized protein n=1 Tax=Penicillium chermesinum TaxID=63820 RepID=A0A9W9P5X7_9EURO|nr:uncharacterized protein N7468_003073 [Penicillium chermesinum]KAJ5238454.1 hypothetical protein N7468_003073 [Penicillium chermesinum]
MARFSLGAKLIFFGLLAGALYATVTGIRRFGPLIDFSGDSSIESFNFEDTHEEHRCINSPPPPLNPIPNVVHLIWLDNHDLTFMNYLTIRSALISLAPEKIVLHHTSLNTNNKWFLKLKDHLTLVKHNINREYPQQVEENWQTNHISDILRLDILQQQGGIYLDMDVISLQPFAPLLHSEEDVVLGNAGGNRHGLGNGIILGRSGSIFIKHWRDRYKAFSKEQWNTQTITVPKQLSRTLPDEICSLSPSAFFWPTWTKRHLEYMHKPLTEKESQEFHETLAIFSGSMHPGQMAYHSWSQMASEYLNHLTPQKVGSEATRFNILVRRFVDWDNV